MHQACLAQEWVQWESESQQKTKTVWWHLLHQEEQEEVAQAVNFKIKQQAAKCGWSAVDTSAVDLYHESAAEDRSWDDDSKRVDRSQIELELSYYLYI